MYLRYHDYLKSIQFENLTQIISATPSIRYDAERAAQEEIKSYLVQKYDIDNEMRGIKEFDLVSIFRAGDTIELDAPAYVAATNYIINQLCSYNYQVYYSKTSNNKGNQPDKSPIQWRLLSDQYSLYNGAYPVPLFEYEKNYQVNEMVFWKDKIYTCQVSTGVPDLTNASNANEMFQSPNVTGSSVYTNTYPDDPNQGKAYWGTGVAYSIPAGKMLGATQQRHRYIITAVAQPTEIVLNGITYTSTVNTTLIAIATDTVAQINTQDDILAIDNGDGTFDVVANVAGTPFIETVAGRVNLTGIVIDANATAPNNGVTAPSGSSTVINTNYWQLGDARNQKLLMVAVDIALKYIHVRIAPRNIPEIRESNYLLSIQYLKDCAVGNITPTLQLLTPRAGARIRWGSKQKNINDY